MRSNSRIFLLCICFLQFANLERPLKAQNIEPDKAIAITVCELTKLGAQSQGRRVSISAAVVSDGMHGVLLVDPKSRCEHGIRMDAAGPVREQDDYKSFFHALYGEGGEIGASQEKGEKNITATFVGIFNYRPKEPRLKWWLHVEYISGIKVSPKEKANDASR
jgi:hypothetical protein